MTRRAAARGPLERTTRALLAAMERAQASERSGGAAAGFLRRMDPRVKVAGTLALVVSVVFARNAVTMAAVLALTVVTALASRVALRTLLAGVWTEALFFTAAMALPALVLTPGTAAFHLPGVPWSVTHQGLATAGYLVLRVEAAATLAFLLVVTTPWAHVLKALRVFRVPVVFVLVLGMTYRYILLLLETARDMFDAHRARAVVAGRGLSGARQAVGSAGVLLSKTVGLSGEVYLAMQARGFRGEVRLLDDFRMRRSDWVALSSFAALAAGAMWAGR